MCNMLSFLGTYRTIARLLTALMCASHSFMRNANLKCDRRMRKLNNPTQSPINFVHNELR
jgi:hypothetical protein